MLKSLLDTTTMKEVIQGESRGEPNRRRGEPLMFSLVLMESMRKQCSNHGYEQLFDRSCVSLAIRSGCVGLVRQLLENGPVPHFTTAFYALINAADIE
jgi:hypothetical protein